MINNVNSFYSYYTSFGMSMGWNGTLVASITVTNFAIAISLLGISLQLLYIIIWQPNHLWMISSFNSVRLVLCAFFALLSIHSFLFVVCIFYPFYAILLTIDVITMFSSFISMIILKKVTIIPRKFPA